MAAAYPVDCSRLVKLTVPAPPFGVHLLTQVDT